MLCLKSVLTDLQRPAVEKHCLGSRVTPAYAESVALGSADLIEGLRWGRSQRHSRHWSMASPFQSRVA